MPKKTKTVSERTTGVKLTPAADERIREIAAERGVGVSEVIRIMIGSILTAPGDPAAALVQCRVDYEKLRDIYSKLRYELDLLETIFITNVGIERLAEADRRGLHWVDILKQTSTSSIVKGLDDEAIATALSVLSVIGPNTRRWLDVVFRLIHPELSEAERDVKIKEMVEQHAKSRANSLVK